MSDTLASTYDEVSYGGNCSFYTHPNAPATIATLFGMRPPQVERRRVLELGRADGSNLIPMAMGLPDARFVGIDLSPRQVEVGRATIGAPIIEALEESIANDAFTIQQGDEPVQDPEQVRAMLGQGVESSLRRMARLALLPGATEESPK